MKLGREYWTAAAVAAVLGLLGVLIVIATRTRGSRTAPGSAAPRADAAPASDGLLASISGLGYARSATAEPQPSEPEVAAPQSTARAFLAQYYGTRWPEAEQAMEAAGAKLDVPYVFSEWEKVAPEFERSFRLTSEEVSGMAAAKVAWPDELTVEWLKENYRTGRRYQLREDDLPLIEEAVASLNSEIRAKARQWAELVEYTVAQRWASGEVLRAPYTTVGLSKDMGFWSQSTGGHGWAVTLTLRREDYPDAAALESELYGLRRRRDETVVRYLHGTIGR